MGKVISIKEARKRKASGALTPARRGGVKGGLVVDWATAKANRPGDERGVIAIIRPTGDA